MDIAPLENERTPRVLFRMQKGTDRLCNPSVPFSYRFLNRLFSLPPKVLAFFMATAAAKAPLRYSLLSGSRRMASR